MKLIPILAMAALLAACGSRSTDDRIHSSPVFERVYVDEPVGPTYGIVLVRQVPDAIYESGAIQITGGSRPYIIHPSAWRRGGELATTETSIDAVNSRLGDLTNAIALIENRLDVHRAAFTAHNASVEAVERGRLENERERERLRERSADLRRREQRIMHYERVPARSRQAFFGRADDAIDEALEAEDIEAEGLPVETDERRD